MGFPVVNKSNSCCHQAMPLFSSPAAFAWDAQLLATAPSPSSALLMYKSYIAYSCKITCYCFPIITWIHSKYFCNYCIILHIFYNVQSMSLLCPCSIKECFCSHCNYLLPDMIFVTSSTSSASVKYFLDLKVVWMSSDDPLGGAGNPLSSICFLICKSSLYLCKWS